MKKFGKVVGSVVSMMLAVMLFCGGVAPIVGWTMNLYKFICILSEPITGWFFGRLVGIIIPIIGAILGYI